jgi:hypothetical protein
MLPGDSDLPLIDWLYAMTFGKPVPQWQSNKRMREALTIARRFLMDDGMAAFLADVAATAFIDLHHTNLQRLFIHEHMRGDPSVGIVTHDYAVVH